MEVLLVQDDPDTAFLAKRCLRNSVEGVTVHWAASCSQAVHLSERQTQPDLVILDLLLPDGNGVATWKAMALHLTTQPALWICSQLDPKAAGMMLDKLDYPHHWIDPINQRHLLPDLLNKIRQNAGLNAH